MNPVGMAEAVTSQSLVSFAEAAARHVKLAPVQRPSFKTSSRRGTNHS